MLVDTLFEFRQNSLKTQNFALENISYMHYWTLESVNIPLKKNTEERTWPAVDTVNRCGYNGQLKEAICDVRGPCQTIWYSIKPVFFGQFQWIGYAFELSTRIPIDFEIWQFFMVMTTTDTAITLLLAHKWGKNMVPAPALRISKRIVI